MAYALARPRRSDNHLIHLSRSTWLVVKPEPRSCTWLSTLSVVCRYQHLHREFAPTKLVFKGKLVVSRRSLGAKNSICYLLEAQIQMSVKLIHMFSFVECQITNLRSEQAILKGLEAPCVIRFYHL